MYPRKPKRIYPATYYLGREARHDGRCRLAQPYPEQTVDSAWWLAGWHDTDMELSHEPKDHSLAAASQAA